MGKMSFDKYIDNPSGEASVVTNRNMYKQMYQTKFDRILMRENGKVTYELYCANDANDSHYVYLKIPSEVISGFYYDVVVQLYTTDNRRKHSVSLREHQVRFYSNDPAFVYTFAHSFKVNDLFISDLERKMSQKALRFRAETKNPKDNVWYVKSLYFAYLAMEKYGLLTRSKFEQNAKKYNKNLLLGSIMQAEEKVKLRQELGERQEREKRKEIQEKKEKQQTKQPSNMSTKVSTVTRTSKVSNKSKATKTTKSIKRKP